MSEDLSKNICTLFSFDTEFSADSVEWCPHKPNQNVFVCANYYLSESYESEQKTRLGRIMLFSVTNNDLKMHQIVRTPGILDQKWCHNKINSHSLLGVVNSSNKLENGESDILLLSLDWSTGIHQSNEPEIVCSDSKGRIHLIKLLNQNLVLLNTWESHNFEAWISAFYYWDTNIFFSGGDDGLFFKFDKRIENQAIAKNKSHDAGVTSLHCNYFKENILASGSYDEYIRLWDMRNIKNEMNSLKMPGTLWRLKWNPIYQDYLLAACMLGGVHIAQLKNASDMNICASFYEHKNISYGADWSYLESDSCKDVAPDATAIIATYTFADWMNQTQFDNGFVAQVPNFNFLILALFQQQLQTSQNQSNHSKPVSKLFLTNHRPSAELEVAARINVL